MKRFLGLAEKIIKKYAPEELIKTLVIFFIDKLVAESEVKIDDKAWKVIKRQLQK